MKKILSLGAAAAVLSLTAVAASAAIEPKFSTDAPVAGDTVVVEIVATGMTQEATTFTVEASANLTLTDAVKTDSGLAEFNTDTKKFAWAGSSVPADGTVLLTLTYTVDAAADEEVSVKLVPDAGFTDISADAVTAIVASGAEADVTVEDTAEEVSSEEVAVSSEEVVVSSEEVAVSSEEEDVSSEEVGSEEVVSSEEEDVSSEEVGSEEDGSGESFTEETFTTEEAFTDDAGLTSEATAEASTEDASNEADDKGNDKGNPATGVALAVVPAVLAGAAIVVAKKRK